MISAGDFRNGMTIDFEGELYTVIDFQHVKPGKGAAFVRVKLKNLVANTTVDKTFRPSEKIARAHIERKDMEFLYDDGDLFYFMDPDTFDQIPINTKDVGDALKYVKPNESVKIMTHKGAVIGIEPPQFVELAIVETEPGHRGDTATNVLKDATTETGAIVHVPIFINIGDVVKIETKSGDYLGRVTN